MTAALSEFPASRGVNSTSSPPSPRCRRLACRSSTTQLGLIPTIRVPPTVPR
ncbi:extensin [Iris pallida]|uniref:Extensin n=1 Tax=Iris pallida TaxID=29817 RepID=A0AAX6E9R4_IRIPA|nr:extensin [Iris pallida]